MTGVNGAATSLLNWLGPRQNQLQSALNLLDIGTIEETGATHGNGLCRTLENLLQLEDELGQLLTSKHLLVTDAVSIVGELLANPGLHVLVPGNWLMGAKATRGGKSQGYPQHSTIDDYPLSAAIWRIESGPGGEAHLDEPRVRTLASVLIAANIARPHFKIAKDLRRFAAACRAFRDLISPQYRGLLMQLPETAVSVMDYHGSTRAMLEPRHPIGSLERYLAWATEARAIGNDNRGAGGGGGGYGGAVKNPPKAPLLTIARTDDRGDVGTVSFVSGVPSDANAKEAVPAFTGAPSDDVTRSAELILVQAEGVAPADVPQSLTKSRARFQAAAIAKQNQRLGGRTALLTPLEAKRLATEVANRVEEGDCPSGALIALASLLLGRSIDALAGIQAKDGFGQLRRAPRTPQIVEESGCFWWVVKPAEPELSVHKADWRLSVTKTAAALRLPCPAGLGQALHRSVSAGRLRDGAKVRQEAREFLRVFDKSHNDLGRYRPEHVLNWLSHAITKDGHDPVVAAIITGDVRAATNAPLHYQQWEEDEIIAIYRDAVRLIAADIGSLPSEAATCDTSSDGDDQQLSAPPPRMFGSIFTPEADGFRRSVEALRSRLTQNRLHRGDPARIIAFHNDYAVYVSLLAGVGLALRGVNNALPEPAAIGSRHPVVVIRDKDSPDGYHARLVPVVDAVRQQISLWLQHLKVLSWHLANRDPAGVAMLTETIRAGKMVQPFIIDTDGVIADRKVTEVALASLAVGLAHPPNVGRHLTATYSEISTTELRAIMGHWIRGTEPFSKHSGLDPQAYVRSVLNAQEALLDQLGLVPEDGFHE
jgi:hypothetical protein